MNDEREIQTDDIELEMNDNDNVELGAKDKVKSLRSELEKAKEEAKVNLDGWQRTQADMANFRREAAQNIERASVRAKERIVEDIIPALDSFDMAMAGESWNTVDSNWRAGMEMVHNQLLAVLESNGIARYGSVGETFDHNLHEALQETAEGDQPSHTIVRIVRAGYRNGDRVIRPAQVIVKQ